MNREIKYIAWDKERKCMIEDVHLNFDFGEYSSYFGDYLDEKKYALMQYIGLKDKNGKEIYEGNIIRQINNYQQNPYEFIGIVEYDGTGFYLKCVKGADRDSYYAFSYYDGEALQKGEIIGNIYENPELLENKQQNENP